jgi:hypothetical protein
MKLIQCISVSQISLFILLSSINSVAAEEKSDRSNLLSISARDLLTQPEGRSQKSKVKSQS